MMWPVSWFLPLTDFWIAKPRKSQWTKRRWTRVSVQGVKSLGRHFACLCRGFEFYEVKKKIVFIFQKENGNTSTLFIIFIVKSLQKEQNRANLLLWPPICRNKSAITPMWFNSLDTNSIADVCFSSSFILLKIDFIFF